MNIRLIEPFSSVNEVICHGIPDQRKLVEGDIVNIGTLDALLVLHFLMPWIADVSVYYDGLLYLAFPLELKTSLCPRIPR